MKQGYKVRLEDGSEIGPLELPAVREWHARGLIHAESAVLPPGGARWVPLHRAVPGIAPGTRGAARATSSGAGPARQQARQASALAVPRPNARRAAQPAATGGGTRPRLAWMAAVGALAVIVAGGAYWAARPAAVIAPAPAAAVASLAAEQEGRRLAHEQRREAVERAQAVVPHLSRVAAELIMSRSQAEVLSPEETFRRSQVWLRRGLSALTPAEARELSALTAAVHARLNARERGRLVRYLERLRQGQATSAEDDAEMARLVGAAEAKLPPARLERLRALYDKAAQAAAGSSAPAAS